MIEAIAKRKSIRSFADKKVEPEKVESLLRAAIQTWKLWIGLTQPGFIIISIKCKRKVADLLAVAPASSSATFFCCRPCCFQAFW